MPMRTGRLTVPPVLRAPLAATALTLTAHVAPAGTWLPGLRRTFLPTLAGLGEPDHVALTFDDGPDPRSTPHFLDALDRLSVRATFFVLGESLRRHPELGHDIVRRGHELAVHGWTHSRPWLPAPGRDLREISRAAEEVRRVSGVRPRWYRPPYGILSGCRWACGPCCGRPGDGTGRPTPPPRASWRSSAVSSTGSATRSSCTTPT